MHYKFRNVNVAFRGMVNKFANPRDQSVKIGKINTRNGPVLQIMEPVILTYENPCERVLFNQARDCNPFFHLYESLWMLAGRNDVAPLDYYLGGRYSQFSDDTKIANGAYGYRWRHVRTPGKVSRTSYEERDGGGLTGPGTQINQATQRVDVDQLAIIIDRLKRKPEDRRCVLSMWNVEDDLLKMETSKDVCCNVCVMFSIRQVETVCPECHGNSCTSEECPVCVGTSKPVYRGYLDMTVINRSNDLANGMLGANVVHFSFLQEYMAAHIGVEVGVYNQISNNLHVYTESFGGFPSEKWLADETPDWYATPHVKKPGIPLVGDPEGFDQCLPEFVQEHSSAPKTPRFTHWAEPFLDQVAEPMCNAFHAHKRRDYESAQRYLDKVKAEDWYTAGQNWVTKRKLSWEAKNATSPE